MAREPGQRPDRRPVTAAARVQAHQLWTSAPTDFGGI